MPSRRQVLLKPEGDPPVDHNRPLEIADPDSPRTQSIAGIFCATYGYKPRRVRVGTRPAGGDRGRTVACVEALRGDGTPTGFACVVAAETAEWALDDLLRRVSNDAQKRVSHIRAEIAAYHAWHNPQSVCRTGEAEVSSAPKTTSEHLANVEAKKRASDAAKAEFEAAAQALSDHIKADGQ